MFNTIMRFNSNGRVVNHPKLQPHAYFATWCNSSTGALTFMVFLVRETERFRVWDLGAGFRTPIQLDALVSTVNLAYILYTMILLDRPQVELQDAVITCNLFDVSPYRCPEFEGRMGESESPIKMSRYGEDYEATSAFNTAHHLPWWRPAMRKGGSFCDIFLPCRCSFR